MGRPKSGLAGKVQTQDCGYQARDFFPPLVPKDLWYESNITLLIFNGGLKAEIGGSLGEEVL